MARLCKGRSYLAALATSLQQTTGKPNRSTTAILLDATCIHPRSMNHVSFSAGRPHLPLGVHRPKTSASRGCCPPSPSRRSQGRFCFNDFAPKHTNFKASAYLSKMFCMSSSMPFRQGCSTALVFHNRFHLQRLDVSYFRGGLSSGTFKRVKDALQPLCFTTVSISISHILKSNMSWELVFPNVQKGQGCPTALVFLNLFHLQHLHSNVWGIRENKPPNSKTSGDLSSLNPLYEFAFWCSFLGAS